MVLMPVFAFEHGVWRCKGRTYVKNGCTMLNSRSQPVQVLRVNGNKMTLSEMKRHSNLEELKKESDS